MPVLIHTKYAIVIPGKGWYVGGNSLYKAQIMAQAAGGEVMEYRPMGWQRARDKRGWKAKTTLMLSRSAGA